jgi:ABC-type transporter Mla MlaB component
MATGEEPTTIVVALEGVARPDLAVVDALARLQLAVRRAGGVIRLRAASRPLCELVELAGLADVLALEADGKPEHGEQLGVQEVVEPGDPVA